MRIDLGLNIIVLGDSFFYHQANELSHDHRCHE
mgnify:CR=1 FL=1